MDTRNAQRSHDDAIAVLYPNFRVGVLVWLAGAKGEDMKPSAAALRAADWKESQ